MLTFPKKSIVFYIFYLLLQCFAPFFGFSCYLCSDINLIKSHYEEIPIDCYCSYDNECMYYS